MLRNPRTMWTVSLGLAALTLLGLSSAIDTPWLSYTLIVLILVATAYGAWRIINLPGPRAQVSPAA